MRTAGSAGDNKEEVAMCVNKMGGQKAYQYVQKKMSLKVSKTVRKSKNCKILDNDEATTVNNNLQFEISSAEVGLLTNRHTRSGVESAFQRQ